MFEHPDEPDISDFPDAALPGGYGAGDVAPDTFAPDILPTHVADEFIGPASGPTAWQLKHVHFVGRSAVGHEQREALFKDAVDLHIARHAATDEALGAVLADPASHVSDFNSQLGAIQQRLAADFGDRMADTPMAVLTGAAFDEVQRIRGDEVSAETMGLFKRGYLLLRAPSPELATLGPDAIIDVGLHEGAHASAIDKRSVIVTNKGRVASVIPGIRRFVVPPSVAYNPSIGGLVELNPDFRDGMRWLGHFWEEAFCDAYAWRAREAMGISYEYDETHTYASEDAGVAVSLAGSGHRMSLINPLTGVIAMPWKYVSGILPDPEDSSGVIPNISVPTLAAYGFDLLDEHLPGLYQNVVDSREDPDLLRYVKEQINSIQPGLYDGHARLPYSGVGFQAGLRGIIGALGLERARITG